MPAEKTVDSWKVNNVLKEFEASLKKYQPNLQELAVITRKINELYRRNVQKKTSRRSKGPSSSVSSSRQSKQWRKIDIE